MLKASNQIVQILDSLQKVNQTDATSRSCYLMQMGLRFFTRIRKIRAWSTEYQLIFVSLSDLLTLHRPSHCRACMGQIWNLKNDV